MPGPPTRGRVAWIARQNGAYLIDHEPAPGAEDMVASDLFTAASSLDKAKAVAVRIAREQFDCYGRPQWDQPSRNLWWLTMRYREYEGIE